MICDNAPSVCFLDVSFGHDARSDRHDLRKSYGFGLGLRVTVVGSSRVHVRYNPCRKDTGKVGCVVLRHWRVLRSWGPPASMCAKDA